MIIAKPVVDKQYWILRQDGHKVGNIEAVDDGYQVKINNEIQRFKTVSMIKQRVKIEFESVGNKPNRDPATFHVHGFPAGCRVYNPIWDVKHKLPLYNKEKKSKSWYAAGWYQVKQHKQWELVQSPKLISLERYSYQGPFYSKEQANASQN
jgi:hypothetical protein